MKITLDEIDSGLVERLRAHPRFASILCVTDRNAAPVEVPQTVTDKILRGIIALLGMMGAQFFLLFVGRGFARANPLFALLFLLFAMMGPTWGALLWFQSGLDRPKRVLPGTVAGQGLGSKEWSALRALLSSLSKAEQLYVDALTGVLEAAQTGRMDEPQARALLADLTGLLENERILTGRQRDLKRLSEASDPTRLENERGELERRQDQATAPAAREALAQSLALLDDRRAQAQEIPALTEQVGAQQELILQTLASVSGSLLRLNAAPASTDSHAEAETERIGASAHHIVQQARSVEQAVQEVMALRNGGSSSASSM